MPKLAADAVRQNQGRIERAALRLFTRQGYHGTSVREIADAAGVSLGNIYNYYRTKQDIFVSLVRHYEERIENLRRKAIRPVGNPLDPARLKRLAAHVREIVSGNPDYWRLMYIDVIEFGSRHFAPSFRSLAAGMRVRLGDRLDEARDAGLRSGIDPALAFTAVYLQFFTYFLVEKLFGGKQHLGMPDDLAVEQLIRIATRGLWRDARKITGPKKKKRRNRL